MAKKSHTRKRILPKSFNGYSKLLTRENPTIPFGPTTGSNTGGYNLSGRQETVSEGHPWPLPKPAGAKDVGGPFFTTRSYVDYISSNSQRYFLKDGLKERLFSGSLFPKHPAETNGVGLPEFPKSAHSSDSQMDKFGTEAIARCKPTNSVANVQTFLGELFKDGIPSLPGVHTWENRARTVLNAGDEFLNVVFGWLPLYKDVTEVAGSVLHAAEVMKQYERDAGKVVRRHYEFEPIEESSSTVISSKARATAFCLGSQLNSGSFGALVRSSKTTKKKWFDGAFTYYLPSEVDSWTGMLQAGSAADKVLGTTLDPSTLWELTPWSWAVDWFSNASELIENLEAFKTGGLVMRYGYMMEESIVEDTYTLIDDSGLRYTKSSGVEAPIPTSAVSPFTLVTKTKQRRPANPFGFGLSWEGLSPLQQAILAALGITRIR